MIRFSALCALLASPSVALAAPRIDIFDSNLQYVSTFDPGGVGSQLIREIKFGPDGHMWVMLTDTSHSRNACNPNDVIKRFDTNGNLVATYKAGLRNQKGFAIDPDGGYWVSAISGCGALEGDYLYKVDANDQVVQQTGRFSDGLPHIDLLPNGRLMVMQWDALKTISSANLATLSTTSTNGYRYQQFEISPATGEVAFATSQSNNPQLQTYSTTGALISTFGLSSYGLDQPNFVIPLADGRIHLFERGNGSQVDYLTLAAGYNSLDASGTLGVSRQSMWAVATDSSGQHYLASWGPDPITSVAASVQPSAPSQASTLELSFETEAAIPPNGYIEVRIAGGFDFSGASTASWLEGGDASIDFLEDPWGYGYYYNDPNAPVTVAFQRVGGTEIPANTPVTISLPGVINPADPGSVAIESIRIYDELWGDQYAAITSGLPSIEIVDGLACEIGSPVDRDGDGVDETCIGTNPTIDDGAFIAPWVQIGDNVTISAGAIIESGALIRSGTTIAPRAEVSEDADIGERCIVSRRAIVEAGAHLGPDSIIGRGATIGEDSTLPDFSAVGYVAVVGRHVDVQNGLVLGALAQVGGAATNPGAVDCVGPLIIARSSQVATDPSHTLTCMGSATIGPDATLASGAILGDRTRFRKGVTAQAALTTGTGVAIGRDATLQSGVTVAPNVRIGARSQVCDNTTVSSSTTLGYRDPACDTP